MQNYFPKKILLLLIIFLCSFVVKAQRQWFATVDPVTGTVTKMDSIAGVRIYFGGYWPTYSEYSSRFTIAGGLSLSTPFYLFTVDASTGHTLNSPLLFTPSHTDFLNFQYAKTGNILYGGVQPIPQGPFSLVTVDPVTAAYTIRYNFPASVGNIIRLIPDEIHDRLYLLAPLSQVGLCLLTIELSTGTVISQVATPRITNLQYNYNTNTFYALANADAQPHAIYSLCTVNPVTGVITNITTIPEVFNITWGSETLDENGGRYFFTSPVWDDTSDYLYTFDINNGNLLHKVVVPQYNVADKDNLAAIRYDNNVNKMYAMFWEAHTVDTPPPPPVIPPVIITPVDSSCRMDVQTKVYSKASGHVLVVDKKVTTCKVSMNVYNMAGQLMLKNMIVNDGYNEIPISNFSTGIYYYKFISEGRILLTGRFLKQ